MKVALVISNYDAWGGGAERWTHVHARMLAARGTEVHLVARRFRGAPEEANCHIVGVPKSSHRPRICFGEAAEVLLRELRPDVIHDMGDGWHADLFMPHHGTRRGSYRYTTEHLSPFMRSARRFAKRWVSRYREFRALERLQYDNDSSMLYLAVSGMIREHMQTYCHVPEDRIRVVYNGIDTGRFTVPTDPEQRAGMRRRLGVGPGETMLLTVAHNFALKGLDTLLRALAILRGRSRPLKLVVVGDGAIAQYQSIARSLGCLSAVHFAGNQKDSLPFYQAADVFALPTLYDPCSLVVLEAMAAGLPVVTSRRNGVHELMQPGVEGHVIDDPLDADELADAVSDLLDPDRRHEAGRAARALAEAHTVEHALEEHLAIYREIAARRGGAPAAASGDPATAEVPCGVTKGHRWRTPV